MFLCVPVSSPATLTSKTYIEGDRWPYSTSCHVIFADVLVISDDVGFLGFSGAVKKKWFKIDVLQNTPIKQNENVKVIASY